MTGGKGQFGLRTEMLSGVNKLGWKCSSVGSMFTQNALSARVSPQHHISRCGGTHR